MTFHVAVIGAGPAGLAAAADLVHRGARVTVFEPNAPGGSIETVRAGDWVIDAGALNVAASNPAVHDLLERVGASASLVPIAAGARRRLVVHAGTPHPIPGSVGELVSSPLLSVRGRLRLLREPFVPRGGHPGESVDAFARRRFGAEVADHLIEPTVRATTGGDARQLLVRALFPRQVQFEQAGSVLKGAMQAGMQARRRARGTPGGARAPHDGMGTMVDALTGALPPASFVAQRVERLELGERIEVTTAAGIASFDRIVLAVPPREAARILGDAVTDADGALLGAFPATSVVSVSLGWHRRNVAHPLDAASMLVPSTARRELLVSFFVSSMFPGRAPADSVLITSLLGGSSHPDLIALGDDVLVERTARHLADLLGVSGEPLVAHIRRWPLAMPQPVEGHFDRLDAVDRIEAAEPRIALAGGWRGALAVGDAMASGIRASRRLLPDA